MNDTAKPFIENTNRHRWNRHLARDTRTRPAILANGETGVAIHYGHLILVLTEQEALALADAIVDEVETNR